MIICFQICSNKSFYRLSIRSRSSVPSSTRHNLFLTGYQPSSSQHQFQPNTTSKSAIQPINTLFYLKTNKNCTQNHYPGKSLSTLPALGVSCINLSINHPLPSHLLLSLHPNFFFTQNHHERSVCQALVDVRVCS